jgi:hypothetical protein
MINNRTLFLFCHVILFRKHRGYDSHNEPLWKVSIRGTTLPVPPSDRRIWKNVCTIPAFAPGAEAAYDCRFTESGSLAGQAGVTSWATWHTRNNGVAQKNGAIFDAA